MFVLPAMMLFIYGYGIRLDLRQAPLGVLQEDGDAASRAMMLSAMVVVREREFGTLERLLVTPVGRLEFLVAKMVPVACVGLFDAFLITAVAIAWFGIPLRGSVLGVAGATLVLQWASTMDPLRYYLVVVRDLFLKGGPALSHPFELAMMALLGCCALGLALLRLGRGGT